MTRLVLWIVGWRSTICKDSDGNEYEAWTRRGAYFHVYHEKLHGGWDKVIRPRASHNQKKSP